MKYFVFNKASDYTRGYMEHVAVSPGGITVEPGFFGKAVFFSRVLDSAREGTIWNRMTSHINENGHAAIQISFYTSDELVFEEQGQLVNMNDFLRSGELSVSEKKERLRPFLREKLSYGRDLLLHGLEGRYLWFLLEIYPQTEDVIELGDFMVSFPVQSWTTYLPEIYQKEMGNNSFLDRYLSIFQSLYDDMGSQIRSIVSCLDPRTAGYEYLGWMAEWLDVEEPHMWNERQLRFLLEHAMEFQEFRGTRRGIELFVELYTGEKPFVVEWQDWECYMEVKGQGRMLRQLYAEDPGTFTVLVREECVPSYKEHQTLRRMLEQIKPIQMDVQLVLLKPYIFIDGYSYLGVNSVLGQYDGAVLGGNSRMEFATVAED